MEEERTSMDAWLDDAEQNGTTTSSPRLDIPAIAQERAPVKHGMEEEDASPEDEGEQDPRWWLQECDADAINSDEFGLLELDDAELADAQKTWSTLLAAFPTTQACGEALYDAFFHAAPSLQSLFQTPKGVQALRFVTSFNVLCNCLNDPETLKAHVETLAFGHLSIDVNVPRAIIVRDAFMDMVALEMGSKLTTSGAVGIVKLLNYASGAFMFTRTHYAGRLTLLAESWQKANDKKANEAKFASASIDNKVHYDNKSRRGSSSKSPAHRNSREDNTGDAGHCKTNTSTNAANKQTVPTTYREMFMFNAAVMGLGNNMWMVEVLSVFDNIVQNVSNAARLAEECSFLVLKIAKVAPGKINLGDFKACMLASLRSLLPKDWTPDHEVAWSWMWENVEKLLMSDLGKTRAWERALAALLESIDEATGYQIRQDIYDAFFKACPQGENYFKQSNATLHLIATKVFSMTLEVFREPGKMVDEISRLGLRHVGYGIPTDTFNPFVTVWLENLAALGPQEAALDAFRWSINLISKMQVRVIMEGSTIVMKAINANSAKMLQQAASVAPRGSRATWLLLVEVGSQKISPLLWAIESGSLEAAAAIIQDLLTIRADRERYYYSVDELFGRHPDIVLTLSQDAPSLLPTLLEGLIWRSRQTAGGLRRVNFYVEHLLVTSDGGVNQAIEWLAASKDVKIIAHPLIAFVADTIWAGVVRKQFSGSKVWFVFSLTIFLLSQAILPKMTADVAYTRNLPDTENLRLAICICRVLVYTVSLLPLLVQHMRLTTRSIAAGDFTSFMCMPLPGYLVDKSLACSAVLLCVFFGMLISEPLIHCSEHIDWPTEFCPEAAQLEYAYGVFGSIGMSALWLLIIDMSVFSTKLSAFVLVCGHVLQEVGRFMVALIFLLLTFASALSVLNSSHAEFSDVPKAMIALFAVTVGVYEKDFRELDGEPVLLMALFLFIACAAILLMNLLIAQLNCSYEYVYADMVGFARMNRCNLIVDMLTVCKLSSWQKFVKKLELDKPLEFDEGDLGPPGGMQISEAASAHIVLQDMILRFGGNSSPELPWPESGNAEDMDNFEKIEALVKKALKVMGKTANSANLDFQEDEHAMSGSQMEGKFDFEDLSNEDFDDEEGDEEYGYDDDEYVS
eukprot:TRINITY_DN26354_c0_g2_i1.p1 TRINITY_DN26354_c0_g2~~TRINITY_DN26354_c0_g2_i1.p1  ORF type:complete len:1139 (-),score=307.76 TRINITY_DN26354_c0_g2_i1:137-3553(-)